ncbi:hypothetical protein IE077_001460 [Cardiosporidium cionae]|uniref:Uncharacterized protein n=1 Tax=Cardiosporidium cionae TaxID=476202 RepID=A0ABQ7JDX3_9APIC|nr:hypothetical protein IE077_001460 [Cardiosporidium cionae]|eukprot:KAF8821845.1 hypothetical protein IE077_001460 [Cardiosporidium cionae]
MDSSNEDKKGITDRPLVESSEFQEPSFLPTDCIPEGTALVQEWESLFPLFLRSELAGENISLQKVIPNAAEPIQNLCSLDDLFGDSCSTAFHTQVETCNKPSIQNGGNINIEVFPTQSGDIPLDCNDDVDVIASPVLVVTQLENNKSRNDAICTTQSFTEGKSVSHRQYSTYLPNTNLERRGQPICNTKGGLKFHVSAEAYSSVSPMKSLLQPSAFRGDSIVSPTCESTAVGSTTLLPWQVIVKLKCLATSTCIHSYKADALESSKVSDRYSFFFFGSVDAYGTDVLHLPLHTLVLGIMDVDPAEISQPFRLVLHFTSLVKLPNYFYSSFIPFPVLLLSICNLTYGLHCVTHFCHLRKDEIVALCLSQLDHAWPILQWLISLDLLIFLYVVELETKQSSSAFLKEQPFFQHASNSLKLDKVFLRKLTSNFSDDILEQTIGMGVNAIIICPDVGASLCLNESQLLRQVLSAVGMSGRVVFFSSFQQLDPIECYALFEKSVSMNFFNPHAIANIIYKVLDAIERGAVWIPDISNFMLFPLTQFDDALRFQNKNPGKLIVCCEENHDGE